MRQISIRILPMSEYYALTEASQTEVVPSVPGVYYWTLDYYSIYERRGKPDQCLERMARFVAGPQKWFRGTIDPYYEVHIRNLAPPFSQAKQEHLRSVLQQPDAPLRELLTCANGIQRPLYVGRTMNLRERLSDHIEARSELLTYLEEVGLDVLDCSFNYISPSFEPVPDEGDASESLDRWLIVLESLLTKTTNPLLAGRQE